MKLNHLPFLFSAFLGLMLTNAIAQRAITDPKHENHYKLNNINTDELSIEFSDAHSQQAFTQVKIKIVNKTNDYILLKPEELAFKYEFGEFKPGSNILQGKFTLVEPMGTRTRTLKVTGGSNFHVEKLTASLGGFYKIKADAKSLDAPDFKLPAAANDFAVGNCKCALEKISKETKETTTRFRCSYTGKNVLMMDEKKSVLKIESGQEFANDDRKAHSVLLLPGDDAKIDATFHVPAKTTDMQLANMFIVWKGTFTESIPQKISLADVNFTLDPVVTEVKNR